MTRNLSPLSPRARVKEIEHGSFIYRGRPKHLVVTCARGDNGDKLCTPASAPRAAPNFTPRRFRGGACTTQCKTVTSEQF